MSNKSKMGRKTKSIKSPYFMKEHRPMPNSNEYVSSEQCEKVHNLGSNSLLGSVIETEILNISRLVFPFFNTPCVELAKALLGKILVRKLSDGNILKGKIVETESYLGGDDKASISFGGKITEKSKPMYMQPGTTFVYLTYGMYNLINISSYGDGAAVLLRALDPVEGMEKMMFNRNKFQPNKNKPTKEIKDIPPHQLCNGPAKLCISLDITKEKCNMKDLSVWTEMWIEPGENIPEGQIVKSRRVGIDSAGPEWANKLLRFYVINNKSVSKRDKVQESLLLHG